MAYAEFAGKQLPAVYHWWNAASPSLYSDILAFSNYGGTGPAPTGSHAGIGPFGTYDMAGNVKEWCRNEHDGQHYILGGGWNEPVYMYDNLDARPPFDRSPANGFRCVKYLQPPSEALLGDFVSARRDYRNEKPVSDQLFRIYKSMYAYDPSDLKPVIESTDDSSPYWREEKISFNAAYGNERVMAYLFLPKTSTPPFQTIVYFPYGAAQAMESSKSGGTKWVDYIPRSGRALLIPIYKGTWERRPQILLRGPNVYRDLIIAEAKDFRRSLDYLETRTDIDHNRLGYYGISLGARLSSIMTADEPRIKAIAVVGAGLSAVKRLPEVDEINFLSHVKAPLLMVNGRDDFHYPLDTVQNPMFKLLGTPEKDKRHALVDGGHIADLRSCIRETLDWFDRYLGPVR
jgi:dienelactone hydrolase